MINNDRLIRACRRLPVDRAPVWMMRQAGRYLPEYRAVRGKTDFLTLCKTPELAAEVSLQPYDILGVDAVIMFSDILIPVEAMGVKLDIIESRGPVIETPIRSAEQVEKLIVPDPVEKTGFVMDVIGLLRRQLDNRAPLIGFAGAPFTLASYLIEGGTSRNFAEIKRMMFADPALLHRLLEKIADTVTDYLNAQIEAGAQVVQLFDTWAGELSAGDYEEFALAYHQRVFSRLHRDPCALLGTPETIAEGVREILQKAGPTGHIMNLGHGIMPMVPVENARAFIETAKAGIREVA